MRYAKLINNYPSYAPNPITVNGVRIGNPPGEVYAAEGYKRVSYTEQPEPQGVGRWNETWTETDEAIVQGWSWNEATDEDEISDSEALSILAGGDIG